MLDFFIHNVKTLLYSNNLDIGIKNDLISYIKDTGDPIPAAKKIFDGEGKVLLPGFNEPHIHLEKAYLLDRMDHDANSLKEAIEMTAKLKKTFTIADMKTRATRVIENEIKNGVTTLRAHVEVDDILKLNAIKVVLKLKEEFKDKIDIQIVVFPQEGIFIQKRVTEYMEKALKMGADVVGGIPYNDRDENEHLNFIFDLAEKYRRPLDLHIDDSDNPDDLSILKVIKYIEDRKFSNGITVAHMTSLGSVNYGEAVKIIPKIFENNINVVTLPATDIYINGREDKERERRGITPVNLLLKNNINLTFGTNNIQNAFTPFGNGSLLDIANLFAEITHMGSEIDALNILKMLTYKSAEILQIKNYGIKVGGKADFILFNTKNLRSVLLNKPSILFLYKNGKKVF